MAIGTAALVIILSVYNGFDNLVKQTLGSVEPDLMISPTTGKVFTADDPHVKDAIDWAYDNDLVKNMSSTIEESLFVNYDSQQSVVRAKGVDSVYETESPLSEHIVEGEYQLHFGELPRVLVGYTLATKLGLNPRFVTKLDLFYPDRTKNISISNPMSSIETISIRPSGVFSVNTDVDEELIVLPIESLRELMGYDEEISAIEIRLSNNYSKRDLKDVTKGLEQRLGEGFVVRDRFHQNESLYKMMKYEKASIFLILIFVIIIIAFNIFGSLSMLIIEKKHDIETLSSIGAQDKTIRRVFVLEGWMISLLGLFAGLVIGIAFALIQQQFGLIKMPGNFAVPAYPVIIKISDLLLTSLGVAVVGYLIALLPSGSIRPLHQNS